MELVPIVITVLEIVSVLAVVTLTISYVLFKFRQKISPPTIEKPQDMKPHFVDRGLKRLTQITREILPPVRKEVQKPQMPAPPKKEFSKAPEVKRPTEKKHATHKTERMQEDFPKRVEVVNTPVQNPVQQGKPEIKETSKPRADLNTLGNDILDKYVDEDNTNLYTLKIDKKEENKK